jgi:hypothetical protein
MSRTTRAVSVSPTTPSLATQYHTRPTQGLLPSWAPLPAPLSRSDCCQATTSRTPPVGMPPPLARSSDCTENSCSSTTAQSSRQWHSHTAVRRRLLRCCQRGRTPAASHRIPGQQQLQVPPTATQPPSFGMQSESAGVPLCIFQFSGPASPAAPEVSHPYPGPCHGAAHQELGGLQGPASALRLHVVRGAVSASPPPEAQGHFRQLHSSSGDECARRASRQGQGHLSLLEAPFMARDHQAHLCQ